MSEADLGLKVASRRLLWRMGFTTRIDVPLRAFIPVARGRVRSRYETFTDLDVLGVAVSPGFALRTVISDCKTSPRGSTERMFWVRGVSDFFAADEAWMVRSGGVTAAARQLAGRLRISVLEPTDLARLEECHPTELNLVDGPLSLLFDRDHVARYMKQLTELDKKLDPLLEYRQFDYWVYEEHRNLLQVVAHLEQVSGQLDPSQPAHRALFVDCAWLYALSLAHAVQHVRAVHISEVDTALQQYVFGGQIALQEKRQLALMLQRLARKSPSASNGGGLLPVWYPHCWSFSPGICGDQRPLAMNFATQSGSPRRRCTRSPPRHRTLSGRCSIPLRPNCSQTCAGSWLRPLLSIPSFESSLAPHSFRQNR